RPFAKELAHEPSFLDEPVRLEYVLRALVIVEDVDAQLAQIHLVEREAHQRADGVAAEAAVPGARLADEEPEGCRARHPLDVVDRRVADVRAVVAALDGEVPLGTVAVDRAVEPLDLV